jgi:predicted DNA-binding antitoxin AbrB/MazE fold protein
MHLILDATYKNGTLVLEQKLGIEVEGKKFKVILIEEGKDKAKKERFFRLIEKHAFDLPEDYKFNREEIHER